MENEDKNFEKGNQKELINVAVDRLISNKISKAEQRIANGESYLDMSELKKRLGIE